MRIFVLGVNGMLGHRIYLRLRDRFDVHYSTRGQQAPLFVSDANVHHQVDAMDFASVATSLTKVRPNVIINCIGIIKQRPEATQSLPSIAINSLFPHQLAKLAGTWGGKLIHFSTDCVFSGRIGGYVEGDPSDAEDLYGRSKFLGEVHASNALTLRTSMIGRELSGRLSLLEWFLSKRGGSCQGFTKHIYSGVTTIHLAELVERLLVCTGLHGLYQVTAPSISKHDLLCELRRAYRLNVEIVPDNTTSSYRTLCGDAFNTVTGRTPPSWAELCDQLANDTFSYGPQ
jgi:dTDP-4-dehydrorhamnose reductase